eukprot:Hpha_TRINITY_DN15475_c0_g4::TRINITY_DN15475_c0_g4_i1::g.174718::m.174718
MASQVLPPVAAHNLGDADWPGPASCPRPYQEPGRSPRAARDPAAASPAEPAPAAAAGTPTQWAVQCFACSATTGIDRPDATDCPRCGEGFVQVARTKTDAEVAQVHAFSVAEDTLLDMGFSLKAACEALRATNGQVDAAVHWLTSRTDSSGGCSLASAAGYPPSPGPAVRPAASAELAETARTPPDLGPEPAGPAGPARPRAAVSGPPPPLAAAGPLGRSAGAAPPPGLYCYSCRKTVRALDVDGERRCAECVSDFVESTDTVHHSHLSPARRTPPPRRVLLTPPRVSPPRNRKKSPDNKRCHQRARKAVRRFTKRNIPCCFKILNSPGSCLAIVSVLAVAAAALVIVLCVLHMRKADASTIPFNWWVLAGVCGSCGTLGLVAALSQSHLLTRILVVCLALGNFGFFSTSVALAVRTHKQTHACNKCALLGHEWLPPMAVLILWLLVAHIHAQWVFGSKTSSRRRRYRLTSDRLDSDSDTEQLSRPATGESVPISPCRDSNAAGPLLSAEHSP